MWGKMSGSKQMRLLLPVTPQCKLNPAPQREKQK